jgi:cytoskeletal protein CcmA (bactofilin family)
MPFWNKVEDDPSTSAGQASRKEPVPMAMKREDAPMTAGSGGDLLLGQGAEFEGKLTFAGTVRIDAKFTGTIVTNDVLVVGEHARIKADITCGTVIVHGEVNGNITAKTAVELRHPGKVRGNIETPTLSIEKGVVFQGEAKMDRTEQRGGSGKSIPASVAAAGASAP